MLRVDAWLNRNAMWLCGSQARNSSSPTIPPRMWTVLVVPTPWGCGLVHVTLVIAVAHCGHDSASSSTSNTCSGVIVRSTVETKRNGALSMKSMPTRSHWCMTMHSRRQCLAAAADSIDDMAPTFTVGAGYAMYRGPMSHGALHRHAAFQIAIGIGGEVQMVDAAATQHRAEALVVAPMTRHCLLPAADLITFFVEPQCAFADRLREHYPSSITAAPA